MDPVTATCVVRELGRQPYEPVWRAMQRRVRRGYTFHGLAFNIAMDLEPFHRINPCGYQGLQVVSLADLGGPAGMDQVKPVLLKHMADQFGLALEYEAALPDLSQAA